MAEDSYQDRTEQPTPKRRAEAREKGQVARSRDFSAALVLFTGLGMLVFWISFMGKHSAALVRTSLEGLRPDLVSLGHLQALFLTYGMASGKIVAPLWLLLMVTAVLANYLQGGWIFAPGRLTPDFSRITFFSGFKRLFSGNSLVELAKSLAKVTVVGLVVFYFMKNHLASLLPLVFQGTDQLVAHLQSASFRITWRVVVLLLALGILDYLYQRHRFEKGLRMTKQEVKDEIRQSEGDPRVKARLRSLMRQLATRRMMAAVPKADVVVTNPTRLAVALKYDSATMIAPQVVAKGRGFVALKIISLAQEAGVPRVENRELAQNLFRLVEVGGTIPTSLYRAVAEVLAYIYSLRAAAGGSR